jgi:hypothetical protein
VKFKVKAEICCSRADCPAVTTDVVELEELPTGQITLVGFHVPEDWDIQDPVDGAFTVLCPEHAK